MYILTILFAHSGIDRRITHDLTAKFQGPMPSKPEALLKIIFFEDAAGVDSHCRWKTYKDSTQEHNEY